MSIIDGLCKAPVHCYYYYDGPLTFSFMDCGQLFLAHWSDCNRQRDRDVYLAVPWDEDLHERFIANKLSYRDAIIRDGVEVRRYVVRHNCEEAYERWRPARPKDIEKYVPRHGVMLGPVED